MKQKQICSVGRACVFMLAMLTAAALLTPIAAAQSSAQSAAQSAAQPDIRNIAATADTSSSETQNRLLIATTDNGPVSIDRLLYLSMRNTGYNVDFYSPVIRDGYVQANDGTCDGVIAGYPELQEQYPNLVPLPVPLERINVRVFAKEGSELSINSWDELAGMHVGILQNRTYILEQLPDDVTITEKETNRAVLNGLVDSEYDVSVLVERDHEIVGEMLSITRVGQVDTLYDYLYLNKKHEAYIPILAAELQKMEDNGSADSLLNNVPLPELNQKRTIVHIISTSVEISRQDRFTTELRSHFEDDMSIEWITVSLDARRFTRGQHNMAFIASLLRADIVSRNVSAVVVSGDTALDFLNDYYYLYFRGTPVLFYAVSDRYSEIIQDNEHQFSGIVQNIEASQTVDKALEMFPDTKNIFVLNDYTDEGAQYRAAIERDLASKAYDVSFEYNENVDITTLLDQLDNLPDDTLVLAGSYFVDANHQYFTMREMNRLLERNCPAPIFSLFSIDPAFNAVGGKCMDFQMLGVEIADMLGGILAGGGIDEIPIVHDSTHLNRWVFDQVQLDRFNINARAVPEDALVVNRVVPISESNPQFFYTMIVLMVTSVALVIGTVAFVLVNRKHTRQNDKLREEALAASSAKSNFLANMSHEMRTPLTTVLGLTELTIETVHLDDETLSNLIKIYRAGETLLGLVNDVLDISKIEAEKFEINEREYELPSLINDTITQCSLYMGEKPIEFVLDIGDDLPNYLYGDDLRVRQVWNNLLSNAFKFTLKGTVEFGIASEREGENVRLTAWVRDTGVGIRAEDVDKLFTMYSKLEEDNEGSSNASRRTEGTGLGLSITKRIAEMMGGYVAVESQYGEGSTFTVSLVQKHVNDALIGKEVAENLRTYDYSFKKFESAKMTRINLSYARVLVVDDNHTNLDVARGLMSLYGMDVDCIDNGKDAVEAIRSEEVKYSAVFMDHMMPGMDGIEAARLIREEIGTDYAKNIPIIALTANAIIGNEEMFLSHGFQAFISKPIDLSKLDSVLRLWVRDKDAEALLPERTIVIQGRNEKNGPLLRIGVPGLDIGKGITHFGDQDAYLAVLDSYARNTKPLLDKIQKVSRDGSGEGSTSLEEYTVIIHGIKGASYGIFAEETGREASALEKAAASNDIDYVLSNNGRFLDIVSHLIDDIENVISKGTKKPEKDKPDDELLLRFLAACEDYNIDEMDETISEINKFDYTGDGGLAEWLHSNLRKGDYKAIRERLSELDL